MKENIVKFLNTHKIISPQQYGFQSGVSTYDALSNFSEFLYKNLDEGKKVLAIFIDFKKAFDTVPHRILLQKLHHYGIRGIALDWFRSYLSGRNQKTRYGEQLSNSRPLEVGLPQGSVLGPLLFNLYINDLANFSDTLDVTLFCDDSTLYLSGKIITSLYHKANSKLQDLYSWVIANRLTINVDKTVSILFSTRKVKNIPQLYIKSNNTYETIKRVQSAKFLGIKYDEHLSFKEHINALSRKLSSLAGMIYFLHSYLPCKILQTVYNAHVNSILNYNTPIWCCNYKTSIHPIHLLQKRMIRNITKSDYLAHSKPLFKKTKILTIYDINKVFLGCQFYKNPERYINLPIF